MNSTHRAAARHKRQQLPKFWRPKLDQTQQLDCRVIHWDLVTRFTDGTADKEVLWDWMETGFTYSQLMRILAEDGIEFTQEAQQALASQLDIYESVAARFRATGRVGFNGAELLIARAAAHVMDELVELDRNGAAERAALWSLDQMKRVRGMVQ